MALVTKIIPKILSDLAKNWSHFCLSANQTHLELTYNNKIGHFLDLYTTEYLLISEITKKIEKRGHSDQKHAKHVVRCGQKLVQLWLGGTQYFSCKIIPQIVSKLPNITFFDHSHLFYKDFHDVQGSESDVSLKTKWFWGCLFWPPLVQSVVNFQNMIFFD